MTADELEDWMTARLAQRSGLPRDDIDVDRPFASYNIDSTSAVEISGELEDLLDLTLEPTLLFEHPTIARLAAHLAQRVSPTAREPDGS
jgi:acyl carrier protein